MSKQKSLGSSTKATSLYFSGSPKPIIRDIESDQLAFLLLKNKELQERILRMSECLNVLQQSKQQMLSNGRSIVGLNSRYVCTLNEQFKHRHGIFQQEMKKVKKSSSPLCKHCNKTILAEFEKDYRNLVRHSIILEEQIISKNNDLGKLQEMKKQLLETKHDTLTELVNELVQTTNIFIQTKKQNNKIQYQNQKMKRELEKNKKHNGSSRIESQRLKAENQNFRSLINTIQNESVDKQNHYKQKIYELEVKIERFQKDIRANQEYARTFKKQYQGIRVEQIQFLSSKSTEKNRSRTSLSKSMLFRPGKNLRASSPLVL